MKDKKEEMKKKNISKYKGNEKIIEYFLVSIEETHKIWRLIYELSKTL